MNNVLQLSVKHCFCFRLIIIELFAELQSADKRSVKQ